MSLTPAEELFFQTGDASALQTNQDGPISPPHDPLATAALGEELVPPAPPVAPVVVPPVVPPVVAPPQPPVAPDATLETLQRLLADANSRAAELEHAVRQQQAPKPPEPEAGPDPTTDPLGALFHQINQVTKQIEALQNAQTQTVQQTAQAANFQQFQQQVMALRDQFVTTTPDFPQAYDHMRAARIADLRLYGLPDRDIPAALLQEELRISQQAIQTGQNPAAVVYEMAKRHGYTPTAGTPPGTPPVIPAKGATIEEIQRAQAASRTLAASPPAGTEEVTLDGLRAMPDKDMNQLVQNGDSWNKFVGGDTYPL